MDLKNLTIEDLNEVDKINNFVQKETARIQKNIHGTNKQKEQLEREIDKLQSFIPKDDLGLLIAELQIAVEQLEIDLELSKCTERELSEANQKLNSCKVDFDKSNGVTKKIEIKRKAVKVLNQEISDLNSQLKKVENLGFLANYNNVANNIHELFQKIVQSMNLLESINSKIDGDFREIHLRFPVLSSSEKKLESPLVHLSVDSVFKPLRAMVSKFNKF